MYRSLIPFAYASGAQRPSNPNPWPTELYHEPSTWGLHYASNIP
jgi:hypothetical protein